MRSGVCARRLALVAVAVRNATDNPHRNTTHLGDPG